MDREANSGWWSAGALALVMVALYLFFASRTTLFDRDEPRFAQATVEMVHSGNYLYPTFNGKLRPDKPIMIYWLMALSVRLLGVSEVAVRFPSILAAAGSALVTYWMGRRLWDPLTGLTAMAILASTVLVVMVGSAATADSVLLLFLVSAMAIHVDMLTRGRMTWVHMAGLGGAIGGASLTKGPVGVAVPLLAILTTHLMLRRASAPLPPGEGGVYSRRVRAWEYEGPDFQGESNDEFKNPRFSTPSPGRSTGHPLPPPGGGEGDAPPPLNSSPGLPIVSGTICAVILGITIFLAWGIPANRATAGQFAVQGLGHHVIDRVIQPLEDHGSRRLIAIFYYFPVIVVIFFPWTLFLPGAISAAWGNRLGGPAHRALLIGWTVPTFILMSLVMTKLPHYILPMWPALALAVAATLRAQRRGELSPGDRLWLYRGWFLFAPLVVVMLVLASLWWFLPGFAVRKWPGLAAAAPLLKIPSAIAAAGLLVLACLVLRQHLARRYQASALTLFMGIVLVTCLMSGLVLPAVEPFKPAPALAAIIHQHSDPSVPVTTCGYGEPTFNFYLGPGRGPIDLIGPPGVAAWARQSGPGILVIPETDLLKARDLARKKAGLGPLAASGQGAAGASGVVGVLGLAEIGHTRSLLVVRVCTEDLCVMARHFVTLTAADPPPASPPFPR